MVRDAVFVRSAWLKLLESARVATLRLNSKRSSFDWSGKTQAREQVLPKSRIAEPGGSFRARELAHSLEARRIVEELDDLLGQADGISERDERSALAVANDLLGGI